MQSEEITLQGIHLTRSFGEGERAVTALNDVTLDLFRGQVTLLMGPSGSGKSTLLAILSGLLAPSSGRVVAMGKELWNLDDQGRHEFRQRHCGFIFQEFNLLPGLQAVQQLELVLRWIEGVEPKEARQRSMEMLEMLNLGKKWSLKPGELSGGEKQRVAIGRALVKRPDLCFADEPTHALDWHHGKQVVELLCEAAHRQNATVLIVAHDPRIIPFVDQFWHLEDGVLSEGSVFSSGVREH